MKVMRGERMKSLADGGGDGGALSGEKDMGKGVVVNASARKRGVASVQGIGGTEKVPSPSPPQCRSKKTTLPPTTAHHHRRSPSLHIDDDGVTTPAGRTLRQSASFSGGITATPPPGSQAIPTLRGKAINLPGKAINLPGKAARHSGPSNSRRVSAGDHHGREVEEDHNVQVPISLARVLHGLNEEVFFSREWLLSRNSFLGFYSSSASQQWRGRTGREICEVRSTGECADYCLAGATEVTVYLRPCSGRIRHPGADVFGVIDLRHSLK